MLFCWIAYAMYWVLERTHRQRGGSLSGRRVLEVLRGIQMGTICLRKADGVKLELERVSTPRSEEALVLHWVCQVVCVNGRSFPCAAGDSGLWESGNPAVGFPLSHSPQFFLCWVFILY